MSHDPITTTTIPAPPRLFPVVLQLGLGLVTFVVLFGLPPCASSPSIDLALLSGLGLWAGWGLVRCLRGSGRRGHLAGLPPRLASSVSVMDDPDEGE